MGRKAMRFRSHVLGGGGGTFKGPPHTQHKKWKAGNDRQVTGLPRLGLEKNRAVASSFDTRISSRKEMWRHDWEVALCLSVRVCPSDQTDWQIAEGHRLQCFTVHSRNSQDLLPMEPDVVIEKNKPALAWRTTILSGSLLWALAFRGGASSIWGKSQGQ